EGPEIRVHTVVDGQEPASGYMVTVCRIPGLIAGYGYHQVILSQATGIYHHQRIFPPSARNIAVITDHPLRFQSYPQTCADHQEKREKADAENGVRLMLLHQLS